MPPVALQIQSVSASPSLDRSQRTSVLADVLTSYTGDRDDYTRSNAHLNLTYLIFVQNRCPLILIYHGFWRVCIRIAPTSDLLNDSLASPKLSRSQIRRVSPSELVRYVVHADAEVRTLSEFTRRARLGAIDHHIGREAARLAT